MNSADFLRDYQQLKAQWKCPDCFNVTNRPRRDNTTVGKSSYLADLDMSTDGFNAANKDEEHEGVTYTQFKSLLDSQTDILIGRIATLKAEFSQEVRLIYDRLSTLETENKALRAEIESFKKSPSLNADTSIISGLQGTISQLSFELNERDQATLLNDVELTGIPEYDGESSSHIVLAIGQKLGVKLEERDIVSVSLAAPPPAGGAPGAPGPPRPAPQGRPGPPRCLHRRPRPAAPPASAISC